MAIVAIKNYWKSLEINLMIACIPWAGTVGFLCFSNYMGAVTSHPIDYVLVALGLLASITYLVHYFRVLWFTENT